MARTTITLRNDFHNTEITLRPTPGGAGLPRQAPRREAYPGTKETTMYIKVQTRALDGNVIDETIVTTDELRASDPFAARLAARMLAQGRTCMTANLYTSFGDADGITEERVTGTGAVFVHRSGPGATVPPVALPPA